MQCRKCFIYRMEHVELASRVKFASIEAFSGEYRLLEGFLERVSKAVILPHVTRLLSHC